MVSLFDLFHLLSHSKVKRFSVHSGDFILSCSGTIGKLFQIPKHAPSGIINQALLLLKINRNLIDEKFFTNLFEFDEFQKKIIDNSHGGAMQNLVSMNDFKKTSFQIPTNMKEQLAISQILSNMDSEIEQLEKQLEKYTNLKQAMMQKLLTGEIRLV